MNTQESMNRLEANVKNMAAANRSRLTRIVIGQVIILIFVVGYLSWAHNRITQVTADDLVLKLKVEAEARLPEMTKMVVEELNAQAPILLESAKAKILAIVPMISSKVNMQIDAALPQITKMTKEKLAVAEEMIVKYKDELDLKMPTLPDNEKIKEMFKYIRAKFRETAVTSATVVAKDYGTKLKDIRLQLEHLTIDEGSLTKKEVMQKRLLEVWIKLIKVKTGGDFDMLK